ncbi:MAG: adenylosuccinate lyase [Clostridia bacterium]|nr:adenylosuccinate lyase [Clostridia bacterium]
MIERYTRKEFKNIWTEENKFKKMLEVEISCCHYYNKIGLISDEEFNAIKTKSQFSVERIHEIEEITKHDVIAFTRCVSESLGEEKRWIHYGLTSTDVVDTANSLMLKQANQIILADLNNFCDILKEKAFKYKNLYCIGRTHGIHAEVTTFGLKFARFYAEMKRNIERFQHASLGIEKVKLSGAVGNYANTPMDLEKFVAHELGLNLTEITTQVLPRDLHLEYIFSLASIATTLEQIATEIRSLSRTEIGEVSESFSSNQKGSSAMPHKKNPITSENICGLSRIVKSYVSVAMENNNLWHERDISHSSTERIILPDATTLVDYMLNRYATLIENLVVNEDRIIENIWQTKGVIFSGRVVSLLINKGLSREDAYDITQKICLEAFNKNLVFKNMLLNSADINKFLNKNEIESCFDLNYYGKSVDEIYKRVFKGEIK